MFEIDLNCDMGEGFGNYRFGHDAAILPYISSVNIACGFHAGDAAVMQQTVQAAIHHDVAIGAHPGLADLQGFGRRNIPISPKEAYQITVYQVGALAGFVKVAGARLHHVKPHGALYNMAAANKLLAEAIAAAVADLDPSLCLYGLAGSELVKAGSRAGLKTASEVFADRSYQPDGSLTPRPESGAIIKDQEVALAQVIKMIRDKQVVCNDGSIINMMADTVCIHGDNEDAAEFARTINMGLHAAGIRIRQF